MSFKDQVVNLIIKGKDLFSSEAKKSEKALADLARQSETLNDRLHELEDLQGSIGAVDKLTGSIIKGKAAYTDNSVALDKLVKEQKQAIAAIKQLDNAHKEASAQTDQTEQEYKQAKVQLAQYEQQLISAKANVDKLTSEQKKGSQASKEQAAALSKASADLKQLEQAQASTEQSAKALSIALDSQRRELLEIGVASDEAGRKKAEYTLKVKNARSELNKLATSLGKSKTELEQQTTKLTKAGYSMDKLADASKDLKQQQAAAQTAISSVNKQLSRHDKLLTQSKKSANDFSGSIKSATGSLFAMAGAYIGVDRLWESLKGILTAGDNAQAFSVQMTAMMGSIASGEQAVAWIKDFANNTGTKLESVQNAFSALKTFGIDPMNGSLQSMVDYNARLGGSQEKLEGIILAVGQAWAKQKLQGEEILQLVERGVPVWDLLEKVTGKNVTQLQKLSASGQLGRETIKALFDEMGKQANGQASKSLDRLAGQINLISNKFEEFKRIIADSGVYQVAVDFLQDLNAQFDQLNQDGKIKAAAEDISQFFSSMIRDSGSSIKAVLENITAFTTALNTISGGIRLFWNGLSAGVSTLAASVTLQLAKMMEGFAKLYEFIGADQLAASARDAAAALNAIGDAYVAQVEQDGKDVRAAWLQITGEVERAATKAYNTISTTAKKSSDDQVKAGDKVAESQDKQIEKIKKLELVMAKAGITTVKTLNEQAVAAKKTYEKIKQGAKDGAASTYELNQAFLKYAAAAVEAAAASDTQVDASIRQQAAALGLSGDLEKIIDSYKRLKNVQNDLGKDSQDVQEQVDKSATGIGTSIENTAGWITKSAEQAGVGLQSVAAHFTALATEIQSSVAKLSDNAVAYFDSIVNKTTLLIDNSSELDKVTNEYDRLNGVIGDLNIAIAGTIDFVGLRTWALETERAGKIAERAYYGQKIELLKLTEALDGAKDGQADLIDKAERSAKSLELLNDQDLSKLTGAIDRAKSRLDSMRQSADDTLSSLRDELDGLQGDELSIQQREYERKLKSIREQLKAAQTSGDKDLLARLQESERLLKSIHDLRVKDIKAETAKSVADKEKSNTPQIPTESKLPKTPPKPVKTIEPSQLDFSQIKPAVSSDVVTFRMQVGPMVIDAVTQRGLLAQLMNEIERQQRLGA
ncbi:phage tail protein [Shewanella sp. Choline-02u-19]|uniref:tape measure protein n=1 Tax=unclassified Shewanella TaxID=196818 RepID=UPI000C34835F|nr:MULTISPECIES: tape measure protein [unclassified Shewanella]PKH62573.1 phage tail protein [Shewanella sp. Bg11-22]PKI27916.1 phage tail protein [Shewanella sp. Choline-02u-19]